MSEDLLFLDNTNYSPNNFEFKYGTAGFRAKANTLETVMFRVGLVANLCSKFFEGKSVGVMITASHNPEEDNGAKVIDPNGEMLSQEWEDVATSIANSSNLNEALQTLIKEKKINMNIDSNVIIAYDTRTSSLKLAEIVMEGVKRLLNFNIDCYGLLTTPQLHFMVKCSNDPSYGEASEEYYYEKLNNAFCNLLKGKKISLKLDCANGVGAEKMKRIKNDILHIDFYNDGNGILNYLCGADFVKMHQQPPEGLNADSGVTCVSFDGDADRLIYFYIDEEKQFQLLDGDKLSTLIAEYFKDALSILELSSVKLGLVQTAYANGNSTSYAKNKLGINVAITSTGVKHLHKKAKEFDIGVYFEANGHGTVVYSKKFKKIIKKLNRKKLSSKQLLVLNQILNLIDLTNETVGDAISGLLLIEAILVIKNYSINEWNALYKDLPNHQTKLNIPDPSIIETADCEQRCISPKHLQEEIDDLVFRFQEGRAFIRPSGTENVLRVYVEASTREEVNQLSDEVTI